ncbi:MAG: hypothetical protein NZL83_03455 [Candidatus Absconditabacterales bacterium]|nr:hypothetical protein [Candidatus Absconditabacterales bacterium]
MQVLDQHMMTSPYPQQEKVLRLYAFSGASVDPLFEGVVEEITTLLRRRIDEKKRSERMERQLREVSWRMMAEGMMTHAIPLPSSCFNQVNWRIYDDVGRAFGIPPVIFAALHRIETRCQRGTHVNGPYQIMSHQYSTGNMSDAFFFSQTVAVARFIHNKVRRYNSRNPDHQLVMMYTGMHYDDVVRLGALYNGLSGGRIIHPITPRNPAYVWGNRGQGPERKNGILVAMVQFLSDGRWIEGE